MLDILVTNDLNARLKISKENFSLASTTWCLMEADDGEQMASFVQGRGFKNKIWPQVMFVVSSHVTTELMDDDFSHHLKCPREIWL